MPSSMRVLSQANGVAEIEIGVGRKRCAVVKIDECNLALVMSRKWHIDRYGYAFSSNPRQSVRDAGRKGRNVGMHRFLANPPAGAEVDHKNGDVGDNRLENLRVCTHQENMRNRRARYDNKAGLKGATFIPRTGRWLAQIGVDGTNKNLGQFDTPEEAHAAYGRAATALHGEFARLA